MLRRVDGPAVSLSTIEPLVALLDGPTFDEEFRERATRINGAIICPRCHFVIPMIQEVDAWTKVGKRWRATEWGMGTAWCDECKIAICEGFDADYVIDLNHK